jgi:hypothetical protein
VSRYEEIFLKERFGAKEAPKQAAPTGGGGGMGMSMGMNLDIGDMIKQVSTTVESGKVMENNPVVYARQMRDSFTKGIAKVGKLNTRLKTLNSRIKNRKRKLSAILRLARKRNRSIRRWLKSKKRKYTWGPLKGKLKDPLGYKVRQNEIKFIRRHGARPQDLPRKNHYKTEIWAAKREAKRNWNNSARTRLKAHWEQGLNIESLRPILGGTVEGMNYMNMAMTGFVLDPGNLKLVFTDVKRWPQLQLSPRAGAGEAKRGIIPYSYRAPKAQDLINLFSKGKIAGTDAAPHWMLGIKPKKATGDEISLDMTDVQTVFEALFKGKPDRRAAALQARNARLVAAGVIAGQQKIEKIEAPMAIATQTEREYAKAQVAAAAAAAAARPPPPPPPPPAPAYEEPYPQQYPEQYPEYPQQPQYPQYPQYPQPQYPQQYPQQGHYQQGYQQYPQQSYYQQQGSYPQQGQQGYYPPYQY